MLDSLLHGQEDIASEQEKAGIEVLRGDVRDGAARGAGARRGRRGRPPGCDRRRPGVRAATPRSSYDVNVEATEALVTDAKAAGVQRFVFASTCSNYGRMADPTVPITEDGELRPVSLYAEQKVGMEQATARRRPRRHGRPDVPALRDRLRRRRRGCAST